MIHPPKKTDTNHSVTKIKNLYQKKGLTPHVIRMFQNIIYEYYQIYGRSFPWRRTHDPYHILVSEIMLQQTTTKRVQGKYEAFINRYPDFNTLANASLSSILSHWQGLGYNRRARYLKEIAETITTDVNGVLPRDEHTLQSFPGIGPYTAAAICVFAFNQPTLLLETNIQSVYIYFFFEGHKNVKDSELYPLIKKTLDIHNPREWYYALMDYGVMIKKTQGNPSQKSVHYTRQAPFKNSNRQLRGLILRIVLENKKQSIAQLCRKTKTSLDRVLPVLVQLEKEGFIQREGDSIFIVS